MTATKIIDKYLSKEVDIAPLVIFRILFAFIMLVSLIRFISNNWIEELYVSPTYHFNFIGFEFVKYPGEFGIYLLFVILLASTIFLLIGFKYHYSILTFFLTFTYIELIDKSLYLNHYYFVSVCSFLMIFLPLGKHFSIDELLSKESIQKVQNWQILTIKILLSIVYLYAGIAKLNSDWLLNAMPLKLWLPASANLPIVGLLLEKELTAYLFSYFGLIYDLTIWIFLLWDKTRKLAYIFVIIFHLSTSMLFQIGMFPYIMTFLTLVFFSEKFHINLLNKLKTILKYSQNINNSNLSQIYSSKYIKLIISIFFLFQIIFPFRYLIYTDDIFWSEEGYRFSWRVMLMEKTGWLKYKLIDKENNLTKNIDPIYELTDIQVKQMSFQPDMIIQYGKYLAQVHQKDYTTTPEIYVNSYVSLNGSGSQKYFKSNLDLVKINYKNIEEYLEKRKYIKTKF